MQQEKANKRVVEWLGYIAAFIIFIVAPATDVLACEGDKHHAYISAGVGQAGTWLNHDPQEKDKWDDDGKAHAHLALGFRAPLFENWLWAGVELGHHSTYNKTPPEPELDYFIFKVEARLIP